MMFRKLAALFLVPFLAAPAHAQLPQADTGWRYRVPSADWWTRPESRYQTRLYAYPPDERVYYNPRTGIYQYRAGIYGNALGPYRESLGPPRSYLGPYRSTLGPYSHLGPGYDYPYVRPAPGSSIIDRQLDARWRPGPSPYAYPPRPPGRP